MNVNLHIERLVLDGVDAGDDQGARLRIAIEAELARLIGEARPSASAQVPALRGETVQSSPDPARFGTAVARSVHGAITK